eukprot:jgi/Botrbrau1/5865/Bobra.0366s0044.1
MLHKLMVSYFSRICLLGIGMSMCDLREFVHRSETLSYLGLFVVFNCERGNKSTPRIRLCTGHGFCMSVRLSQCVGRISR